ncbi:hypothetical protein [Clostridium septicum]|uniref:Protein containing Zn-finger domain n=1 Tax=Clostridium septicum TaxID=1504 RepID=A0ABY5AVQ0_CLOSE|nr:hypothetical protein [Clostridium septicum]MDU1314191.1 hypothetical protein [Clostridium septicum]UEC19507.1 hypothetical protein LK444_08720 [Clostridium septicum]USR99540.1 hypothetical protein NH397_08465 [Clostridium septicum]WLF68059.1 hypothetical protein Q6375_08685 [Clostridium septicum]
MINDKYTEDDYCDLNRKKICDNCGKCLEEQGMDIKAIKIEDIAKTVEENEYLENELKKALEELKKTSNNEEGIMTAEEFLAENNEESGYVDAFDHIEYLEDGDFFDEVNLDELTEEIFPGVRKLKSK